MNLMYNKSDKFGIYIHVPFCRRRCIYCDFYFEIGKSHAGFESALLQEWEGRKTGWQQHPNTLYFGGGTPSLLSASTIKTLVQTLAPQTQEITLEANPEDLTPEYLKNIQEAGVNRLSLGVQSLEDPILKFLGRKHRSEQAKQAILDAKQAGFERISVDLIIGVAGENLDYLNWLREQQIGHLSVYLLTVEPLTPLSRFIQKGRILAPCEDQQADAYINMQKNLNELGYQQYEISSYALPGQESQHNRIYWSQGSYLGLGPGAHSMQLNPDGSVLRRHTHAKLAEWQLDATQAPFQEELLSPEEALLESLAFGIRDIGQGIKPAELAQKHQTSLPESFKNLMEKFAQREWVTGHYKLTSLGARFADAIAREILAISP
ncbi:MAG: radical SAM family heme chaperone HemW [Myxococcaceae bacterium]